MDNFNYDNAPITFEVKKDNTILYNGDILNQCSKLLAKHNKVKDTITVVATDKDGNKRTIYPPTEYGKGN